MKKLLNAGDRESGAIRKKQENDLKRDEKRRAELDSLFTRLYEDWVAGRITEIHLPLSSLTSEEIQTMRALFQRSGRYKSEARLFRKGRKK